MDPSLVLPVLAGLLAAVLVNYLADELPRTRALTRPACRNCGTSYAWTRYIGMKKCTMLPFGPTELIIILIIVILLFGVGRIGKIAGELRSGIRSFRKGLQDEDKTDNGNDKAKEENAENTKE